MLSQRTQAVWDYIKNYMLENDGNSPTIRDFVNDNVDGITSTSVAEHHIRKLAKLGHLSLTSEYKKHRRIRIPSGCYALPPNVINDEVITKENKFVTVLSVKEMVGCITLWQNGFLSRDTEFDGGELDDIVIVTEDPDVELIAIGLGFMVVDEGIYDRIGVSKPELENA
jgi:hypothetical protein